MTNKTTEVRLLHDDAAVAKSPIDSAVSTTLTHDAYKADLRLLQFALVDVQRHFIGCGDKIFILLAGRDAAGKDGSIKRIVKHLSPRETRVVALGEPSDRDLSATAPSVPSHLTDLASRWPDGLVVVRKSAIAAMTGAPSSFWQKHNNLRKESSFRFPDFFQKVYP